MLTSPGSDAVLLPLPLNQIRNGRVYVGRHHSLSLKTEVGGGGGGQGLWRREALLGKGALARVCLSACVRVGVLVRVRGKYECECVGSASASAWGVRVRVRVRVIRSGPRRSPWLAPTTTTKITNICGRAAAPAPAPLAH